MPKLHTKTLDTSRTMKYIYKSAGIIDIFSMSVYHIFNDKYMKAFQRTLLCTINVSGKDTMLNSEEKADL